MAAPKLDPQAAAHLEWLGFVQPVGLVVSAAALVSAGAMLDRRDALGQELLRECLEERRLDGDGGEPAPVIADFPRFAERVLGWTFREAGYAGGGGGPIPEELEVAVPEYGELLRPDFAVRERNPAEGEPPWQLLIRELPLGEDLDATVHSTTKLEASPHQRMERLLRETRVRAGLLCNGRTVRLISAPRGESSGWLDFRVEQMAEIPGRPISTALRLLLSEQRLLALPEEQRLAALLHQSRLYQNEVSERLAQQVLHALYELLRGFQAADETAGGALLRGPLRKDPDQVYHALLTVILRLVFVLYAEEREMLPGDEVFLRHYSLAGLYDRLREDAIQHPDTLDQRFGAWAQLLALFRMVHDGADVGADRMPARRGVLFDPDRFSFLEGREGDRQTDQRIEPPAVSDGTIFRALEKLLVLNGERISYRALDVEQIGSVYETMMGFRLERTEGPSVAIRSPKSHGAPAGLNLEGLLREDPGKRAKYVKDRTDRKLTPTMAAAVKAAESVEGLHAALEPLIDAAATPDLVPAGALVLQPSQARRRSGSHYTPRGLTDPIVRTTLVPVLELARGEDGSPPTPDRILALKVCDPAMGSGAFLVEVCRQLGDALVEAWAVHGGRPEIPPDEDEVILARRLVAQRCLYGVDRNPVAVDLAKMSLWLATLAREHALTFVDHALRHGDSLVGLSRPQIECFHWDTGKSGGFEGIRIRDHLDRAAELRKQIREAGDSVSDGELRGIWEEAQRELYSARLFGDLATLAFFSGAKRRDRQAKRDELARAITAGEVETLRGLVVEAQEAELPLVPFHWEIEFPEVFERENSGFDAIVGNPPFAGKNSIAAANPPCYPAWLKALHEESHGNADLVAHFFRRSFNLIRRAGAFGLIATNTIGQGDTRSTGLRWIRVHGGEIFEARRRLKWPGQAAVVVSVVHLSKGTVSRAPRLDGREVEKISAFLFHRGDDEDPHRLEANRSKSFIGSYVLGMGFTFDDTDSKGVASPLAEMQRLVAGDPANAEVIFPYIGGEELNASPAQQHHRYVIDFGDRSEEECRRGWPELMAIVEKRVKPERLAQKDAGAKEKWWQFIRPRPELRAAIADLDHVIAVSRVGQQFSFVFLPTGMVYAERLVVIPFQTHAAFCALQSRPHEVWVRFFGATMKDDLLYTPSDCFDTFPFPSAWESDLALEEAGRAYYEHRAALMAANDEGLTKTYNRFHDPAESDAEILRMRELHTEMDRIMLSAYGWDDVPTEYDFILDHEDEEGASSRRKKPWRYRWPDDVRDEVLARLVELNGQRAAEERLAGDAGKETKAGSKSPPASKQEEALF